MRGMCIRSDWCVATTYPSDGESTITLSHAMGAPRSEGQRSSVRLAVSQGEYWKSGVAGPVSRTRAARNEGAAKITASAVQRASGVATSQREPSRATRVTTWPVFTLSPTIPAGAW